MTEPRDWRLQPVMKVGFVKEHDLSRAEDAAEMAGLQPLRDAFRGDLDFYRRF